MVVLGAQLVVHKQDCDFSTSNAKNEEDNQRKSKNIVELVHPQRGHDEEEFDISSSKWNYSTEGHSNHWVKQSR